MKKKKHLLDFLLKSAPKNYARNTRQTVVPGNHQQVTESERPFIKRDTSWMEFYASLRKFKKKYGHCMVPSKWPEDTQLAVWVRYQRHRASSLSHEKYLLLEKLGFAWDHTHCKWMDFYLQLVAYHKTYGNCNPPESIPQHQALSRWVMRQRRLRRSGNTALKPEYIHLLNTLDFDWEYRRKIKKKSPKRGLE